MWERMNMVRHRMRYLFDTNYRIACIADEVARRMRPEIEAGVRDEIDRISQRVAAATAASFSD